MEPISRIDSSANQLFFRGLDAIELASNSDFESVLYLLVHGALPNSTQLQQLRSRMIELRGLYREEYKSLVTLVKDLDIIGDQQGLNLYDTLLAFVTLCPIVIAHQYAESQGKKAENPNDNLGHAANFLWMIRGSVPKQTDLADFQAALILPMDDPDNPSLSALLEVLDRKEVSKAILAALQEHVGPLHHGAGAEAMMMLEEIKEPKRVTEVLSKRLKSGVKIFGLGHRIYTGIDPRAVVLRGILERRTLNTNDAWLVFVSDEVAKVGGILLSEYKGIQAFPNIDLYNAAVFHTFGFPPQLNTSLFAISRSTGWMAHILE